MDREITREMDGHDASSIAPTSTSLQIHGLVQERRNSIANALELRCSCTNPSKWYPYLILEVWVDSDDLLPHAFCQVHLESFVVLSSFVDAAVAPLLKPPVWRQRDDGTGGFAWKHSDNESNA